MKNVTKVVFNLAVVMGLGLSLFQSLDANADSSRSFLAAFQQLLAQEITEGASIASFVENYANGQSTLEIALSNGDVIKIQRLEGSNMWNDEFFSLSLNHGKAPIGSQGNSNCIIENLQKHSERASLRFVGVLFDKDTLAFGFSDKTAFTYNALSQSCLSKL